MFEDRNYLDVEAGTPIALPEELAKKHGAKYGLYRSGQLYRGDDFKDMFYPYVSIMQDGKFFDVGCNGLKSPVLHVLVGEDRDYVIARYKAHFQTTTPRPQAIMTGTDPEVFVVTRDGVLLPAYHFLPNKHAGQHIYWDGFQAEFRTEPRACHERLAENIQNQLLHLMERVREHNKTAKLTIQNTFQIPSDILLSAKEEHVAFGCEPSFNVYNEEPMAPGDARLYPFRSAGGHIHASITKPSPSMIRNGMYALDGILGVCGVSLAQGIDTPTRRRIYGRAGEFRLPKYGIEYRVLSNFWLMDPSIYHLTFEIFRMALGMGLQGLYNHVWDAPQEQVREVINNCDVKGAQGILEKNKKALMWILEGRFGRSYRSDLAFKTIMDGASSIIKDPNNIMSNWTERTSWALKASYLSMTNATKNSVPVATV